MNILKQNLDERREMILNGNILNTMLLLSIPTFMMGIIQYLVPFTDSLFLNNILGTNIGAAVGYSQPAIGIFISISQGIGVVAMSMIGQLNGVNDVEKTKKVALQIIVFGFIIGIILMPITWILGPFLALRAPKEIFKYVIIYFSLYAFIIPFQFMASIFNSIKYSTGEPESPFYRMLVLLIFKIAFNFIFLKILNLKIYGTILASLLAYLLTTIWMYYDLFVKEYKFRLNIKDFKFDISIMKEVARLGVPAMLTYLMINLGFMLINFEISKYGSDFLAALSIASQISNLCFMVSTIISTSLTTMISMNITKNEVERSKKIYKLGLLISIIISIIMLILILVLSKNIVNLFTRKENVEKLAIEALNIYTYSVVPYSIFIVSQGVYNALGKNIYPLIMSFLRIWVFRYLFILLTDKYLAHYSIYYGNLFSNFLTGIIFYIIVKNSSWKNEVKYE